MKGREHHFAPRPDAELRQILDRFLAATDPAPLVARDPVSLVRRYEDPADQEVAGLVVSALAYGRASSILTNASEVLAALGPSPARGVLEARRRARLSGFVYRFQRGEDLPRFLASIAAVRTEAGSLASAFGAGVDAADPDYAPAIARFSARLRAAVPGRRLSPGLRFLLPGADGKGASKRPCLYLRWMVRGPDGVDLGAFTRLEPGRFAPSALVIPLDTHIERIGRYIGLTDRRSGGLEMAREITARLRRLRPEDPLAYDLALCHLGIAGSCPRRRDLLLCRGCPIRGVCRLGPPPEGWPDAPLA